MCSQAFLSFFVNYCNTYTLILFLGKLFNCSNDLLSNSGSLTAVNFLLASWLSWLGFSRRRLPTSITLFWCKAYLLWIESKNNHTTTYLPHCSRVFATSFYVNSRSFSHSLSRHVAWISLDSLFVHISCRSSCFLKIKPRTLTFVPFNLIMVVHL